MATIEARGRHQFRAKIRRNGQSIAKTFETRKDAEDWARVMEGRVTGGEVVEKRRIASLAEACAWMLAGQIADTPDAQNAPAHYRYWAQSRFKHWALNTIHDWSLIEWRKEVLDEEGDGDGEFSAQTCIHRLNGLSKLYQLWGRAHRVALVNPVQPGVRPGKPEGRNRRLGPGEEERLLEACDRTSRPWLRHAVVIALETAMRQSEQHGLTWERVHLDKGFLDLLRTKNDRPRRVPLSNRAREAFEALRGYPRPMPVETRGGIIQAFIDARGLCGSCDLRWHDLRHEAVSRLFELTDLRDHEIMAISGHLTSSMLARYTHLRSDRLADRLPGGAKNRAA